MKHTTAPRKGAKIGRMVGMALLCCLLLIGFLCLFAAIWYVSVYGHTGFDSVLFTLTSSLNGVQSGLIVQFLCRAVLPALVCTLLVSLLLFWQGKPVIFRGLRLWPWKRWVAGSMAAVLSLSMIVYAAFEVELVPYLIYGRTPTELYQQYYRDPASVQITFPEKKRNLIYIMLESMETSYLSADEGGALEYNIIPELFQLAQENINFSHNDTVGGFREVTGNSWTIGAMVGQTGGVPLKVPDGISDWQNGYGKDGEFLPGLTSLTSILQEQGYYQALMVGSAAEFGGRDTYFETHGIDAIYDIYTARRDGIVPPGYWDGWWGMEDFHLFSYAKEKLTEISQMDQPFAFTMLTVDTHHIGGHACSLCGSTYEENYENVIACSSRQVYEFVLWLQAQPFYEDTTVIITGDHCSMDKGYFSRNTEDGYVRHVYNCFLNAAATPVNTANREFCAMDMFPTTLAAMGCTIEGQRLGLGTNLFSEDPTLIEQMGYYEFCVELSKKSDYYEEHFYGKVDS